MKDSKKSNNFKIMMISKGFYFSSKTEKNKGGTGDSFATFHKCEPNVSILANIWPLCKTKVRQNTRISPNARLTDNNSSSKNSSIAKTQFSFSQVFSVLLKVTFKVAPRFSRITRR